MSTMLQTLLNNSATKPKVADEEEKRGLEHIGVALNEVKLNIELQEPMRCGRSGHAQK